MIRWFALMVALMPAASDAEGVCLDLLEGGGPKLTAEIVEPWSIIFETTTIPGYPWLVIRPGYRNTLYTVRDRKFEELRAGFPAFDFLQYKNFAVRRDGSVIGFGASPTQLWILESGAGTFRKIEGLPAYVRSSYDADEDKVYLAGRDNVLYELDGEEAIISPVSGLAFTEDGVLPRHISALGGYIAVSERALWFHPDGDGVWDRIGGASPGKPLWAVGSATILEEPSERMAMLSLASGVTVIQRVGAGVPTVLYHVDSRSRPVAANGGAVVWRRNGRPSWVQRNLLGDARKEYLPDLVLLTPDGPVQVPGDPVQAIYSTDVMPGYAMRFAAFGIQGHDAVLVDAGVDRYIWDGSRIEPRPDLSSDRIGLYVGIAVFEGRPYLRTDTGLYSLDSDLRAERVPLPFSPNGVWDGPLEAPALGGALLLAPKDRSVWFTSDARNFEQVANRTGSRVVKVIAELPGRRAVLALTEKGAALVADCDSGG